jgi:adenine-specific DNA-methyltransferase
LIKYLGSKRALVPLIQSIAARLPVTTACDLFAGTTRVGQALRAIGLEVVSNDLASYSAVLAQAYVVADETVDRGRVRAILAELDALEGRDGYVSEVFCRSARYFQPHNGRRIDAIRDAIDGHDVGEVERGILLTSLLEAADRVDSTTGVQMAYLKQWAPRSHNALELRLPEPVAGPSGAATACDANALAAELDVDLVYVDPPYNQHSFFSNYHVWETIVRWDAPESYGVARKRVDCRERKSRYNSRREAPGALAELLGRLQAPWLIVSASDESFHPSDEVERLLALHGHVVRIDVDSRRYVGAQIGIYNPAGKRVGRASHLRNWEHLFLVGPDRTLVEQAAAGAQDDLLAAGASARTAAMTTAARTSAASGAAGASSAVAARSTPPAAAATATPRPRR